MKTATSSGRTEARRKTTKFFATDPHPALLEISGDTSYIGPSVLLNSPTIREVPAMIHIAKRMQRLGTETAFEVLAKARALEAQGKNIVHLEIGEPDFDTPANIRNAAKKALDDGFTHYSSSAGLAPGAAGDRGARLGDRAASRSTPTRSSSRRAASRSCFSS